jgi:D-tyrosyl-tRNA(Tyr) deacylase
MRALVRRVLNADVKVDGTVIGAIGPGLVVYLGVEEDDEGADLLWLVKKILGLRIFDDAEGLMNRPLPADHGILVISQFTLLGNVKKGSRPSFNRAAKPEKGEIFYLRCIDLIKANFTGKLEKGKFGADMKISSVDDGPVTIWLDSRNRNY